MEAERLLQVSSPRPPILCRGTNQGQHMLAGDIRRRIDPIWNAFWSGGISDPLGCKEIRQSTSNIWRESSIEMLHVAKTEHYIGLIALFVLILPGMIEPVRGQVPCDCLSGERRFLH